MKIDEIAEKIFFLCLAAWALTATIWGLIVTWKAILEELA